MVKAVEHTIESYFRNAYQRCGKFDLPLIKRQHERVVPMRARG
jgi:hypothetical protein